MLRIIQKKSADSAKSYYSQADYLNEGQEQIGTWGGRAASLLGLEGRVDKSAFDRLCDNQHPTTGEQLSPRMRGDRTVGYDLNFTLPKGISIAYALNQDDRILTAFRQSVRETMEELEKDAAARVRRRFANSDRTTGNLVWAEFVHHTARPVDGVPDMDLHAHCFAFNTTFDDAENRWKAVQFRNIKRDAPYYEAAFHARFSLRLAKLGYQIERKGRNWDIGGLRDATKRKFSRRSQVIEQAANEDGIIRPQEKEKLAAMTREAKQPGMSMVELREHWLNRIDDQEQQTLAKLCSNSRQPHNPHAAEHALTAAKLHSFERSSVVPTRRLAAESLQRGLGQVGVEEALRTIDESDLIEREWHGRQMITSPEVIAEEMDIIDFAKEGKDSVQPLNAHWQIERDWLNQEQREAVEHILNSRERVTMLKGGAGTGKTSLMTEAVAGIEAGGHHVLAFAPSAEASRGVLQTEGFEGATTVAELLVNQELQQAARGQVIWVDESGLLGTKTMKRLLELASSVDARLVLSGDWNQHGSVERGRAMRLLEQQAGLKAVKTSKIQRQKSVYRQAVGAIAEGNIAGGFAQLDDLGWIVELDDNERLERIANDYADSVSKGMTTLMVSPTNAESQQATRAIRDELQQRKMIGSEETMFTRLRPKHLTAGERQDAAFYDKGDVIIFQQNAKGHRKGERIIVDDYLPAGLLDVAERFAVYRPEAVRLSEGDQIRFTANGKTTDGQHRLNNGSIYQVQRFTNNGDIKLTNGWIVSREYGHLTHGYVTTSYASQGKTVDHVMLAESEISFPAAGAEQFYVSVSRGRKKATIYTSSKDGLLEAVRRTDDSMSATELSRLPTNSYRERSKQLLNHVRQAPILVDVGMAHA